MKVVIPTFPTPMTPAVNADARTVRKWENGMKSSSNERTYRKLSWRHSSILFRDSVLKYFEPRFKFSQVMKMFSMMQTLWHFWSFWKNNSTSKHRRILYNQITWQSGISINSCKRRTHTTSAFVIILTIAWMCLSTVEVLLLTTNDEVSELIALSFTFQTSADEHTSKSDHKKHAARCVLAFVHWLEQVAKLFEDVENAYLLVSTSSQN